MDHVKGFFHIASTRNWQTFEKPQNFPLSPQNINVESQNIKDPKVELLWLKRKISPPALK